METDFGGVTSAALYAVLVDYLDKLDATDDAGQIGDECDCPMVRAIAEAVYRGSYPKRPDALEVGMYSIVLPDGTRIATPPWAQRFIEMVDYPACRIGSGVNAGDEIAAQEARACLTAAVAEPA